MTLEEDKQSSRFRLLVIKDDSDDVERFHYPDEVGVFKGYKDGRILLSFGHDTLSVKREEVTQINECS